MSEIKKGFTPTPKFFGVGSQRKLGFTLIELLVVIAIIAILSTIILGTLGGARKQARDSKRLADLKQLQTVLELYANINQDNYPTTLNGLVTGGFVPVVPLDPDGGPYSYTALGSGTSCKKYHLGATLEDVAHAALKVDFDDGGGGGVCTGSAADFAGTDPVYDLKP